MARRSREQEAQSELDRIRHQAGGALTGPEARQRAGLDPAGGNEDPPLDWSMTPRNVILQLAAIALFVAVAVFIGWAFFGGFSEVLSR